MEDNNKNREQEDLFWSSHEEKPKGFPEGGQEDGKYDVQALAKEIAKELASSQSPHKKKKRKPTEEEIAEQRAMERKASRRRLWRGFRNLVLRTALLAVVVYVLFFHLVGITLMPNGDMYPRIDSGDLVLFYRLDKDIRSQDVIVLEKPASSLILPGEDSEEETKTETRVETARVTETGWRGKVQEWYWAARQWLGFKDPDAEETQLFVCRVVAVGGDSVEVNDSGRLFINGNAIIENNIFYSTPEYAGFLEYPVTLGEGEYFVLADKRNGGADSRFFGPVSKDEILGTVITIVRRNNL